MQRFGYISLRGPQQTRYFDWIIAPAEISATRSGDRSDSLIRGPGTEPKLTEPHPGYDSKT